MGRSRTFTTQLWSSADLLPSAGYFLRAQVTGGVLTFYMQQGFPNDAVPDSLKGTPNATSGGGFPSTPMDICIAWVVTAAPGSVPVVRAIYNRSRLSWTRTLNGSGVVYLPLDPHARAARLIFGNPTPSSAAVSSMAFPATDWVGGNYSLINPVSTGVASHSTGWSAPMPCIINTNNVVNDVTVSTLTASFDHVQLRSLWQSYQTEHLLGSTSSESDELLFSMGIKNHPLNDYATGIAINFSAAVNINLTWELIR